VVVGQLHHLRRELRFASHGEQVCVSSGCCDVRYDMRCIRLLVVVCFGSRLACCHVALPGEGLTLAGWATVLVRVNVERDEPSATRVFFRASDYSLKREARALLNCRSVL
jgi:hypothetical protein